MARLTKWQFWLCLLLSLPAVMVAQSELTSKRADPPAEYASAIAMGVPAAMFLLAAAWIASPVGLWLALIAALLTCGLVLIGMCFEAGLEAGLIIYAVAAMILAGNMVYRRKKVRR